MAKAMNAMKVGKPMKAMKVAKAMKAKKAIEVSKVAMGKHAKSSVLSDRKEKTSSGLKPSTTSVWTVAVTKARKALGVKGYNVAVVKGGALYNKAQSFYKK
eukprot:NODE_24889_length_607_cov_1.495833.p2 GENE.NODE_24889_length_607_cov_1.495833~~NODE_24889_length_607_cov_1.495833.p2  ORF type:complete len:101 (+),score=35.73 NODE_24889_length_607_cov_1.495833:80-382(+)